MAGIHVKMNGLHELEKELNRLNSIRFDAVVELQTVEMVNRASASHNPAMGGTPYDTGELMESVGKSGKGYSAEVGYTREYAAHVEYGHRTRNGGFVPGQHYLNTNVEIQRPRYREDLENAIRRK